MSAKQIVYSRSARAAILRGVNTLADAVLSGMLCGTIHPNNTNSYHQGIDDAAASSLPTHITVGGLAMESSFEKGRRSTASSSLRHVQCLDVWEGLRPVASYGISADAGTRSKREVRTDVAVTALAGIPHNGTIVAGCTDRTVRLLDSRLREVATIKGHMGGVVNVAASDCTPPPLVAVGCSQRHGLRD